MRVPGVFCGSSIKSKKDHPRQRSGCRSPSPSRGLQPLPAMPPTFSPPLGRWGATTMQRHRSARDSRVALHPLTALRRLPHCWKGTHSDADTGLHPEISVGSTLPPGSPAWRPGLFTKAGSHHQGVLRIELYSLVGELVLCGARPGPSPHLRPPQRPDAGGPWTVKLAKGHALVQGQSRTRH